MVKYSQTTSVSGLNGQIIIGLVDLINHFKTNHKPGLKDRAHQRFVIIYRFIHTYTTAAIDVQPYRSNLGFVPKDISRIEHSTLGLVDNGVSQNTPAKSHPLIVDREI